MTIFVIAHANIICGFHPYAFLTVFGLAIIRQKKKVKSYYSHKKLYAFKNIFNKYAKIIYWIQLVKIRCYKFFYSLITAHKSFVFFCFFLVTKFLPGLKLSFFFFFHQKLENLITMLHN
jgi:hypothetical protein